MKVIFICMDWFHPAYKAGGPVQSISNLVNQYRETNLHFKIFCGNTDLDGSSNKGVAYDKWCRYNDRTEVWYASESRRGFRVLRAEIMRSAAPVIFIIGIYSLHFNLFPILAGANKLKIVSVRGMLHPGALAQKSFKKKVYLAFWKLTGLHKRCIFHATDEQEVAFIEACFGPQVKTCIAGNFPRSFQYQIPREKEIGKLKLVSIALISPIKNILLVLKALAACKAVIEYDILGPIKDHSYWEECLQVISSLPSNIRVEYHGDLHPSLVEKALKNKHVFILPSESENFGHAFFEALSAGKPVITSYNTPWNLLEEAKAGKNVSTTITSISNGIEFFASFNAPEYEQWSHAATAYAAEAISFNHLERQYNEMFALSALPVKS